MTIRSKTVVSFRLPRKTALSRRQYVYDTIPTLFDKDSENENRLDTFSRVFPTSIVIPAHCCEQQTQTRPQGSCTLWTLGHRVRVHRPKRFRRAALYDSLPILFVNSCVGRRDARAARGVVADVCRSKSSFK